LKGFATLGAPHLQAGIGNSTLVDLVGGFAARALGFKHGFTLMYQVLDPMWRAWCNLAWFLPIASIGVTFVLVARAMNRRSPAIIAAVFALGLGMLAYLDSKRADVDGSETNAEAPTKDAENDPASADSKEALGDSALSMPTTSTPVLGASRFNLMPDGSAVPALPEGAPTEVKLGIAIFRYQGAQSPPESRRTKKEAEELAKKAIAAAQSEFLEAVKLGDLGSHENIGWIKQGVLEKAVEYAVFTTDKESLGKAPIDTPRGYWVIKRLRWAFDQLIKYPPSASFSPERLARGDRLT
jgi:hypothetical protein